MRYRVLQCSEQMANAIDQVRENHYSNEESFNPSEYSVPAEDLWALFVALDAYEEALSEVPVQERKKPGDAG